MKQNNKGESPEVRIYRTILIVACRKSKYTSREGWPSISPVYTETGSTLALRALLSPRESFPTWLSCGPLQTQLVASASRNLSPHS